MKERRRTGRDVGGRKCWTASLQRSFCLDSAPSTFPPPAHLTSINGAPGHGRGEIRNMCCSVFGPVPLGSSAGGRVYFLVRGLSVGRERSGVCRAARGGQVLEEKLLQNLPVLHLKGSGPLRSPAGGSSRTRIIHQNQDHQSEPGSSSRTRTSHQKQNDEQTLVEMWTGFIRASLSCRTTFVFGTLTSEEKMKDECRKQRWRQINRTKLRGRSLFTLVYKKPNKHESEYLQCIFTLRHLCWGRRRLAWQPPTPTQINK